MSPLTTIFMLSLSVLHTKKGRMQASQFTHKPATRAVPLALSRDQGPREGLVMEGLVELRAHFANPLAARFLPTKGIASAQQGMQSSSCNRSQVKRVATRIGQPALGAPAHVLSARAVQAARVLPDTHGSLSPFLSRLSSHDDCCTRIALLGGSTACGGHSGDGKMGGILTGSCGFPAGMNGTWAASLVRYLNARTTDCCRRGHDFRNLCASGRGTEYMLEVFDSLAQRGLAEAQLIFVDTAVNDYNSWFVQEFRPSLSAQHLERKRRHAAMVDTEQLLRLLRRRAPRAAVMYVETACVCRRVEPVASHWRAGHPTRRLKQLLSLQLARPRAPQTSTRSAQRSAPRKARSTPSRRRRLSTQSGCWVRGRCTSRCSGTTAYRQCWWARPSRRRRGGSACLPRVTARPSPARSRTRCHATGCCRIKCTSPRRGTS